MFTMRTLLAVAFVFGGVSFGKAEEPEAGLGTLCMADFLYKEVNYRESQEGYLRLLAVQEINSIAGVTVCDNYLYKYLKIRPVGLISVHGAVHELWQLRITFLLSTTLIYVQHHPSQIFYLYGAIAAEGPLIPIPVPRPDLSERVQAPDTNEPAPEPRPPIDDELPEPDPWLPPDEFDVLSPEYLHEIRF